MRPSVGNRSVCAFIQQLVLLAGIVCVLSLGRLHAQPIQYVYDDLGRLIKVIDQDGNVAEYIYDTVGNILEIRRSTIAGLAVLSFTPSQGPVGTRVTISGQGFNPTPSANAVLFNGVAATITTATATSLVVTVPQGATTGPLTVTVAGNTATSAHDFTVLQVPVITSVNPRFALAGTSLPAFRVQGVNLANATFAFLPALTPPAITVDAATTDPSGTAATLRLTVAATATGQFALIAANAAGSSDTFLSPANTLHVLTSGTADPDEDGLTTAQELALGTNPLNPDTDGDGFIDGLEVALGSNPLDAGSIPSLLPPRNETVGLPFAALNPTTPSTPPPLDETVGSPLALVNRLPLAQDSDGDGFSDIEELSAGTNPLDPTSVPSSPRRTQEVEGSSVAVLNTITPSTPPPVDETVGYPFSIENL